MDYNINSYSNLSQNELYNLYRLQYANQNGNYAVPNNYLTVQTPSFRGSLETLPDTFTPSMQLQSKKEGMPTLVKWGLGALTVAGITFGAIKFGKVQSQKKAIQEIEKKFTDLQNDMPKVQKTFKEVFLRDDLTEKEVQEMLNRYKEIEKLGVTGTKEEYIRKLFEEANKNYGIKPIKLIFETPPKTTIGGSTSALNQYIKINPNRLVDEYWDIIHHELRHTKQHILGYNSNPQSAREAIFCKEIFDTNMQPMVEKSIDELIDKGILDNSLQKTLAEKYKVELDEILRKNFGELNSNNIPKEQKELAEKLINSFLERDNVKYTSDHDYYKNCFFEVDARFAGESIAKLFNKPTYLKS